MAIAANQRCRAEKATISIPRVHRPAGAGRVIAREHRAQHAPRISREGVVFREPPDMAGGPVFSAQRRVAQPQSLGYATAGLFHGTEGTARRSASAPALLSRHCAAWPSSWLGQPARPRGCGGGSPEVRQPTAKRAPGLAARQRLSKARPDCRCSETATLTRYVDGAVLALGAPLAFNVVNSASSAVFAVFDGGNRLRRSRSIRPHVHQHKNGHRRGQSFNRPGGRSNNNRHDHVAISQLLQSSQNDLNRSGESSV
jgi:hypothetical protein